MKLSKTVILFLIIFISSSAHSQYYEKLKETSEKYLISFSNKLPDQKELTNLKEILFTPVDKAILARIYQTTEKELDSLKNHFNEYEEVLKNIPADSAFVLFNQWYLHFSNTFYNYAEEKFFSSDKIKLLLFSASVSCACTLEMCRKQTSELINFAKQNGYEFLVVDSYENNQLQIEYETLFAPSVIVFDGTNKVLYKIEYDENMIQKLSNYLNINKKI